MRQVLQSVPEAVTSVQKVLIVRKMSGYESGRAGKTTAVPGVWAGKLVPKVAAVQSPPFLSVNVILPRRGGICPSPLLNPSGSLLVCL